MDYIGKLLTEMEMNERKESVDWNVIEREAATARACDDPIRVSKNRAEWDDSTSVSRMTSFAAKATGYVNPSARDIRTAQTASEIWHHRLLEMAGPFLGDETLMLSGELLETLYQTPWTTMNWGITPHALYALRRSLSFIQAEQEHNARRTLLETINASGKDKRFRQIYNVANTTLKKLVSGTPMYVLGDALEAVMYLTAYEQRGGWLDPIDKKPIEDWLRRYQAAKLV